MSKKIRVYVAGPLFNTGERYEQLLIAKSLEKYGYETFLPQRDGLKLDALIQKYIKNGMKEKEANELASQDIFNYDIYQIFRSDAIVSNVSGIEPDSGTVSETAIASCMGKAVIIFTDDIRTFGSTTLLNPLLSGLKTVPIVTNIDYIPQSVWEASILMKHAKIPFKNLSISMKNAVEKGAQIAR